MNIVDINSREHARSKLLEFIQETKKAVEIEGNEIFDAILKERSVLGKAVKTLKFPKFVKLFIQEKALEGIEKVFHGFPYEVPVQQPRTSKSQKIESDLQKEFDNIGFELVTCFSGNAREHCRNTAWREIKAGLTAVSTKTKGVGLKSVFSQIHDFVDTQVQNTTPQSGAVYAELDYRSLS